MGIRHGLLTAGLLASGAPCFADSPDLPVEQVVRIEALSCRAWHDRAMQRHRIVPDEELALEDQGDGKIHVALACEAHDSAGGWSVRDEGHCEGAGQDWTCESWTGLFRTHDAGVYEASLSDTSVNTGVQILEHLIDRARQGELWANNALAAHLDISPYGESGTWHVEYEWTAEEHSMFASIIEVRGRCRKEHCRFRSKYLTSYGLLR